MPVTYTNSPAGDHPRYLLIYGEAPGLTDIKGLISVYEEPELEQILVVTRSGETEPVEIEQEKDFTWTVFTLGEGGRVVEQILFDDNNDVVFHHVYVDGFDTDRVPEFAAEN